ncbi:hydroxypyruvate isomerase family protein [Cognatishimia maritima]|uniref:Hydroxypyruvate isomerase n=1 Tax=Cognatishimia maritima TaxID=870908 RepID=A0A1M5W0W0_9RHOB|nr:TIM barrel protein [Cognatishimia maritima]SHH81101.1 hydroxypyruvate isomerase [Cognatishimia maritima]
MKFSANLGFLWADRPLPEAIRAAKAAGFDAVECHWPYQESLPDIKAALDETQLPLLGLNTRRGDATKGEMGLSALPDRQGEARDAIDEALDWGAALGACNVHVMAGFAEGEEAEACFLENLRYAARQAASKDMTILIEPLNVYDAPGYFLSTTAQAAEIINQLNLPNVKLMFDCYHVQLSEGDICNRLSRLMRLIGHIQFAGVPARGRPDQGEINYDYIFSHIASLGYSTPLGAEYKPMGHTEDTLGWLVRRQ